MKNASFSLYFLLNTSQKRNTIYIYYKSENVMNAKWYQSKIFRLLLGFECLQPLTVTALNGSFAVKGCRQFCFKVLFFVSALMLKSARLNIETSLFLRWLGLLLRN